MVTDKAALGDGGNSWGGHQTRMVRTKSGLYCAYTVAGQSDLMREWRLAQRTASGWRIVARGPSGREPVNLLRGPDDRLHVVAWPDKQPRLWSSSRPNEKMEFVSQAIPGSWPQTDWPYGAAAINPQGDIYVLASYGDKPGELRWACRLAAQGRWTFHVTPTDYRFCYTYVLPGTQAKATVPATPRTPRLALVSTRDVRWESLEYAKPPGAFGYVFNAVALWHSPDENALNVNAAALQRTLIREEKPSARFPDVLCNNAQGDAYQDVTGRIHVLYQLRGPSTQGRFEVRHAVVENGRIVWDAALPAEAGYYCRLVQDRRGRLYLIGANSDHITIYTATPPRDFRFHSPVRIDLKGYNVAYSGIALAAPRGGVPPADFVDGVFPSGQGEKWVYFRINLRRETSRPRQDGRKNESVSRHAPRPGLLNSAPSARQGQ